MNKTLSHMNKNCVNELNSVAERDKWKTTVREPPADIARRLQHECQRLVAGDPFWRNVNRPPRENGEEQFFKRQEGNGQSVETLLSHQ